MRHTFSMRSLALVLLLACKQAAPLTPEQAMASPDGSALTVQGTVFGITFDERADFSRTGDRFLLIRGAVPLGVTGSTATLAEKPIAFGLGLRLTAQLVAPQIGDVVQASGKLAHKSFDGVTVPMLEELTELRLVQGQPPLKAQGETCAVDMECRDELICERATLKCAPVPAGIDWGSPWHDVNGACDTDADCPPGQVCEQGYAMRADAGVYAPYHAAARDEGRHLCVPAPGATQASLCPRVGTAADLAGGRWPEGKEACVAGKLLVSTVAEDEDTHTQLAVPEPLPYARADAPYWLFGATTENGPPYKDPARPQGAIATPAANQQHVVMGTIRYDPGHGWWEVHPIKAWWAQ